MGKVKEHDRQFRLIENQYEDLSHGDYCRFKNDYLYSDVNSEKLRVNYNLSKKQYSRLVKQIKLDEGISYRPRNDAKYYYPVGDGFRIYKKGKFNVLLHDISESLAKWLVEQFKACEWDYCTCESILKDCGIDG